MAKSDFENYWVLTSHGEDAPPAWKQELPVGCRFAFARDKDEIWHYMPGQDTKGPFGRVREATLVSDERLAVDFQRPIGLVKFTVRSIGRKRLAIELWPPGKEPDAGHHGGAHGIDD